MKVLRRTMPLDLLSVEEGNRRIILSTHRQTIILSAYKSDPHECVASHELTFDQLFTLLDKLKPGIEDVL